MNSVNGVLNGTTEVEIVSAPSTGQTKIVSLISIANTDSAAVNLTLLLKDGSNYRRLWKSNVNPDVLFLYGGKSPLEVVCLDTTSKSIVAKLGSAVTTNQPDFIANYEVLS